MSKKSNVHPDHYKTDGRDRPDDAARARLNRAIAAKVTSQQRPDRMGKEFYFERPEPAQPEAAGEPGERLQKKSTLRARAAKPGAPGARKPGASRRRTPARKKAPARKKTLTRKTTPTRRKAGRTAKPPTRKK